MPDKHTKFQDLAEKRVNRAIKDLRLIANLANKHNYEYTQEEADKIISVLEAELKDVKSRFRETKTSKDEPFKLKT